MNYLLDTSVVSEWVKPKPGGRIVRWLAETHEDRIFLTVLTFTEVRQGIGEMAAGARRDALDVWFRNDLPQRFDQRIVGVDLSIAEAGGRLLARSRKLGLNLGLVDAMLAATAETRGLTLVTRNTKHFAQAGIELLNPRAE